MKVNSNWFLFLLLVLSFNLVSASTFSGTISSIQTSTPTLSNYYGSSVSDYWPILTSLENDECSSQSTDFIIAIPVGGCEPTVVRSDLLAEQNVPVFCQLTAIRVNPLIDVSTISAISFSGELPEEVAGISYHPADVAIKNYNTVVSDAVEEDIGSVVITLKKQPQEDDLEKYVSGILTATIKYSSKLAYGVGNADFYLEEVDDDEWQNIFNQYSFWANKGYLRAESLGDDAAKIEVLLDRDSVYSTIYLEEGQSSETIYYPGYYCTVGFKVKLNKITNKQDMALIYVDDDSYWAAEGSYLGETGCKVIDLNSLPGGTGDVTISCPGGKLELSVADSGFVFIGGGQEGERTVHLGDSIQGENSKRYYLGYIGEIDDVDKVILFDSTVSLTDDDINLMSKMLSDVTSTKEVEERLDSLLGPNTNSLKYKDHYKILAVDDEGYGFIYKGHASSEEEEVIAEDYSSLFEEGDGVLNELLDTYPLEQKSNEEYWGEEALFEQIQLASKIGYLSQLEELIPRFLSEYPSSDLQQTVLEIQENVGSKNFENAYSTVLINNEYHQFYLGTLSSGEDYANSVKVEIGGAEKTLKLNRVYNSKGDLWNDDRDKGDNQIRVTSIDVDSANFRYFLSGTSSSYRSQTIDEGETYIFDEGKDTALSVKLKLCNVTEVAYVSIIPYIKNDQTQTNFTFSIGIEQRDIQLSPEAANKTAEELEEKIEKLQKITDSLKKVVEIGNTACLGVTGLYTLENFLDGLSGETTARKIVNSYFAEYCENNEEDVSIIQCYKDNSVEDVVDEIKEAIQEVNSKIGDVRDEQEESSTSLWNLKDVSLSDDSLTKLKSYFESEQGITISGTFIEFSDLSSIKQIRAALLYDELGCSSDVEDEGKCSVAKNYLEEELSAAAANVKADEITSAYGVTKSEYATVISSRDAIPLNTVEEKSRNIGGVVLAKGNLFKVFNENQDVYLVNATKNKKGEYNIFSLYNWTTISEGTKGFKEISDEVILSKLDKRYSFYEPACGNSYQNPEVIYYSNGYAKDKPAVVPLDIEDGLYVSIPSGTEYGYDKSGTVNFFYICSVGEDGEMDLRSPDDSCQGFNLNNLVYDTSLCSKSESEMKTLYQKAVKLITQAEQSEGAILLDGQRIPVGDSISSTSELDCLDYMSAEQCEVLFNVCDPFVCPPSRCDYGGEYPVEDVTSTGILGGLLACYPNAKWNGGDVYVPVCFTAIYAGLENLVSVMESYQSCLRTRAESGEYVGICDSITAVYLCNLLWDYAPAAFESLLPSLLDLNKGGEGGGEYLTGADSVQNLQESVGYFTDYYASNLFDSFELGNDIEVETDYCSTFSTSGNVTNPFSELLAKIVEPESPAQSYAYFSESSYTTQTNPPTSQYKVYYQIYAGNEYTQTSYAVSLKNPSSSYSVIVPDEVILKTGTLTSDNSVSETLDFTAPSGYKELCVTLNEVQNCGFGSTGTSMAGDYATDLYVSSQLDDDITTTDQCQSSTVLGISTLDDISSLGITRVCASSEPESSSSSTTKTVYCTDAEDCDDDYTCEAQVEGSDIKVCMKDGVVQTTSTKWVDVGYCDDTSIRCWLDRSSVEDVLSVMSLEDVESMYGTTQTIKELEEYYSDVDDELMDIEETLSFRTKMFNDTELSELRARLRKISGYNLDDSVGKGENAQKAQALAYEAWMYRIQINFMLDKLISVFVGGTADVEDPEVPLLEEDLEIDSSDETDVATDDLELPDIVISDDFEFEEYSTSEQPYITINDVIYSYEDFNEDSQIILVSKNAGLNQYCFSVTKEEGFLMLKDQIIYDEVDCSYYWFGEETSSGEEYSDLLNKMIDVRDNYIEDLNGIDKGCYCYGDCENYAKWIYEYSEKYSIDPYLLLAQIIQESQCSQADSTDGSYGLMQITAIAFKEYERLIDLNQVREISYDGGKIIDDFDNAKDSAEANIAFGLWFLNYNKDKGRPSSFTSGESCYDLYKDYSGWDLGLRGYNGWSCNSKKHDLDYVEKINYLYDKLKD